MPAGFPAFLMQNNAPKRFEQQYKENNGKSQAPGL